MHPDEPASTADEACSNAASAPGLNTSLVVDRNMTARTERWSCSSVNAFAVLDASTETHERSPCWRMASMPAGI